MTPLSAQSIDEGVDSLPVSAACSDSLGTDCLVLSAEIESEDDGYGGRIAEDDGGEISGDDGYGGEIAGALIGSVVSFYGLGILFGGGSLLFLIPGALIGMGIGSKF